jgi:hypothetical protein
MPLHVKCPHCRVTVQNIDRLLPADGGNLVSCPDCRKAFRVAIAPRKPAEPPVADVDLPSLPEPPETEIPVLEEVAEPQPEPIVLEPYEDDPPPKPKPTSKRPSSRPIPPRSRPNDYPPARRPGAKRNDSAGLYIGIGIGGVVVLVVAIVLLAIPGGKQETPPPPPQVVQRNDLFREPWLKGDEVGKEPNFNDPPPDRPRPKDEPKLNPNPVFPPNFPPPNFPPEFPNFPPNPVPRAKRPEKEWDIGLPKADPPAAMPGVEIPATPVKVSVERKEGIRRAPFDGESKVIDLPGVVDSTCVGGGGRFLIFFLRVERQLAIFDVNEAKVVKQIPTPDDTTLFAANRKELLTVLPRTREVKRYSFQTFEEAGGWKLPQGGWAYTHAMMGADSDGPLVVAATPRSLRLDFDLFDPATGRELPSPKPENHAYRYQPSGSQAFVTADGKRLCYPTGFGPGATRVLKITEGGFELPPEATNRFSRHIGGNYHFVVPNADGSELYGQGQLFASDGAPVGRQVGSHGNTIWFVPAVEGKLFLSFVEVRGTRPKQQEVPLHVGLHLQGVTEPFALIPPPEGTTNFLNYPSGQSVPFHRHVFFIPSADVLAILPTDKRKLHLRRIDAEQLAKKADPSYLFVDGALAFDVKRGEKWEAPLRVRHPNRDKVEVRVESGPSGLKLTPEGKLSWEVPPSASPQQPDVVLRLSDGTGKVVNHTIKLRLVP